jgi:hypothetical protein
MQSRGFVSAFWFSAASLLAVAGLSAQSVDSIRASYILELPPKLQVARTPRWNISPGSSSGTPTAYGAEFRDIFFGAEFQERTRYSQLVDGSVYGGFGLGNPRSFVGIELVLTSFTTIRHGFSANRAQLQHHRQLPAFRRRIRLGGCHPSSGTDGGSRHKVTPTFVSVMDYDFDSGVALPLELGTDDFKEQAFYDGKHGVGALEVLLHVIPTITHRRLDGLGSDARGVDSSFQAAALHYPAVADVTGSAGDGARFVIGADSTFDFN